MGHHQCERRSQRGQCPIGIRRQPKHRLRHPAEAFLSITHWKAWNVLHPATLLHDSLNRNRFKDKIMQHFKVLQRP
ncbi:hypothetical protein GHK48_13890 [Sinorhizobium fredii]|uniref:Uncharacterized protein n=1 Tax=Rhizobium fredii TaxID=380 RepID=A0A844ACG6_RHIFR|nr:hypothetical protein [Sinorhizobium fredii]MQX09336.1 hypothetical protein [Sinorhizobium fredii]